MPETIAVLQPAYLPWLGYFEQMAVADRFVFLDDVQYTHRDWRNRNRIKTAAGSIWLTVPIKRRPLGARIREIEVNYEHRWQRKHLLSIEQSYGRCDHFQPFFDELEAELRAGPRTLVELDCRLIRLICRYLEIDTPTCLSSELAIDAGHPQDPNRRLIEICRRCRATRLYEGARGADYIDLARFRESGIEVVFQDYRHPVYRQPFGDFLSHQSAIDLILNTGPEAPAILRGSGAGARELPEQGMPAASRAAAEPRD